MAAPSPWIVHDLVKEKMANKEIALVGVVQLQEEGHVVSLESHHRC